MSDGMVIKVLRQARGEAQEDLARRAKVPQQWVSLVERDRGGVSAGAKKKILTALLQGPAPNNDSDLDRPTEELHEELCALHEAVQVVADHVKQGKGDRDVLLAMVEALIERMKQIGKAVDLRLANTVKH